MIAERLAANRVRIHKDELLAIHYLLDDIREENENISKSYLKQLDYAKMLREENKRLTLELASMHQSGVVVRRRLTRFRPMSNKIWPHVEPRNPCPICGKTDWCQYGDRAVKCMRVESPKVCPSGGWYHFYEQLPSKPLFKTILPKPTNVGQSTVDISAILTLWLGKTRGLFYADMSVDLGVSEASLITIGAVQPQGKTHKGYPYPTGSIAFPMYDSSGKMIGLRIRSPNYKWTLPGSRNGFFAPTNFMLWGRLYIPEGATDLAALYTLGLNGVSRPNSQSCIPEMVAMIKTIDCTEVVIISDNDERTKVGNKEIRPGMIGAKLLQSKLVGVVRSTIWIPPTKDLRSFLKQGGTRQMIESSVQDRVWK